MTVTNTVQQAAPTASSATSAATAAKSNDALGSLTGNFNNFLQLLMTQLQNQDPTAPMDTNQFTSQLVQFTSVEQQINTNSSLTQLITATQGNTLLQSSSLVGQNVAVSGDQLSLQGGTAGIRFQTATPEQVDLAVYTPAGVQVKAATVQSTAGTNDWTWDGTGPNGQKMADGVYKVVATGPGGSTLPFNVLGTATGVQRTGANALQVQLGSLSVDFGAVQSVGSK